MPPKTFRVTSPATGCHGRTIRCVVDFFFFWGGGGGVIQKAFQKTNGWKFEHFFEPHWKRKIISFGFLAICFSGVYISTVCRGLGLLLFWVGGMTRIQP